MAENRSLYGTTDFVGDYIEVNQVMITGTNPSITIGLTTINDEEVTVARTMGIPNSGVDGQFVITNGDVDQIIGGNNTFTGMNTFEQTTTFETDIKVNTINEYTLNNGVMVDGLLIKDGLISDTAYSTGILHSDSLGGISSSSIVNADVNAAAGITYGKLSLTNGIVNADVNSSAGITYGKLSLTNGIVNADVNSSAGITYGKLSLTNSILGSDIKTTTNITCNDLSSGHNIYCEENITSTTMNTGTLTLAGALIGTAVSCTGLAVSTLSTGIAHIDSVGNFTSSAIVNGDISGTASISYSKLNLANSILNSDLAGSIADTKLLTISTAGKVSNSATTATSANTASAIVARDVSGNFTAGTITATTSGAHNGTVGATTPNTGAFTTLSSNSTTTFSGLTTGIAHLSAGGVLSSSTIVNADVSSTAAIAYSKLSLGNSIVNADINSSAAIAYSKLSLSNSILNADLAGSIADTKLLTISTAGKVSNSATTATSANTVSAIVARDASGDFSARTITLSGNLSASSGYVSINEGSGNGIQWANTGIGSLSSIYSSNRNTFIFQMNGSTLYTFTNTGLSTSPYTTAGLLKSIVTTGQITSALLVDADVSASAAIADSKLATISTAGKVSNSATTATSANTASAIVARDGSGNFLAGRISGTSFSLDAGTNSITGVLIQAAWSPTVTDAAGNACTYLSRAATYSRLGNRVWVNAYIQINAKTGLTAGDTIRIGGLPYSVVSYGNIGNWNYGATSFTPPANTIGMFCEAINGTTYMNIGWQITTGARGALVSELNATGYFSLSCCYSV